MFKAWQFGTCSKSELLKKFIFFSAKMTVFTCWGKVTEIQHIFENHIYCSDFGSLEGGQNTKSKKIFVFLGTKFCFLKMTLQDFKNSYHPNLDLKYVIWFCLAFGKQENQYVFPVVLRIFFFLFSQSLNPMTEGGGVNSNFHISHDWSTSLWNTYEKIVGKFTAKQKRIDPSDS